MGLNLILFISFELLMSFQMFGQTARTETKKNPLSLDEYRASANLTGVQPEACLRLCLLLVFKGIVHLEINF